MVTAPRGPTSLGFFGLPNYVALGIEQRREKVELLTFRREGEMLADVYARELSNDLLVRGGSWVVHG